MVDKSKDQAEPKTTDVTVGVQVPETVPEAPKPDPTEVSVGVTVPEAPKS